MAKYTLPDLPYAYDALAPHLSQETMELHHDKHHAAYVKAANETIERLANAESWQVPGLERALAFNVSGHGLHTLFWDSMSPEMEQKPSGALADAIDTSFGSMDKYLDRFKAALTTIQGSGWALLMWEPMASMLEIVPRRRRSTQWCAADRGHADPRRRRVGARVLRRLSQRQGRVGRLVHPSHRLGRGRPALRTRPRYRPCLRARSGVDSRSVLCVMQILTRGRYLSTA